MLLKMDRGFDFRSISNVLEVDGDGFRSLVCVLISSGYFDPWCTLFDPWCVCVCVSIPSQKKKKRKVGIEPISKSGFQTKEMLLVSCLLDKSKKTNSSSFPKSGGNSP